PFSLIGWTSPFSGISVAGEDQLPNDNGRAFWYSDLVTIIQPNGSHGAWVIGLREDPSDTIRVHGHEHIGLAISKVYRLRHGNLLSRRKTMLSRRHPRDWHRTPMAVSRGAGLLEQLVRPHLDQFDSRLLLSWQPPSPSSRIVA